jgi:hypothetical protein
MKSIKNLIGFTFLLAFVLSGCKTQPSGQGGGADSTATDTVYFDPVPECVDLAPKTFCWDGLDFISLRDSLTWKTYPTPEGGTFKDTVFVDSIDATNEKGQIVREELAWNVRMLHFATGTIYLEADFEEGFVLNRVRIETPEYKTKSGVGVGTTVAGLAKAFEGELLYPMPFVEFGVMEIARPVVVGNGSSRMVFHIPLGAWYQPGKAEYTMADLPQDAKVVRVVLM